MSPEGGGVAVVVVVVGGGVTVVVVVGGGAVVVVVGLGDGAGATQPFIAALTQLTVTFGPVPASRHAFTSDRRCESLGAAIATPIANIVSSATIAMILRTQPSRGMLKTLACQARRSRDSNSSMLVCNQLVSLSPTAPCCRSFPAVSPCLRPKSPPDTRGRLNPIAKDCQGTRSASLTRPLH